MTKSSEQKFEYKNQNADSNGIETLLKIQKMFLCI